MNTEKQSASTWSKLARLAASAPPEPADMPFGFSTRIVAQWRAQPRETTFATLEWLTVRGLAIAALVFLGSAAIGYEALSGVISGETSVTGGLIESLLTL